MTTRACSPRNIVGGPGFNKTVWLPLVKRWQRARKEAGRSLKEARTITPEKERVASDHPSTYSCQALFVFLL